MKRWLIFVVGMALATLAHAMDLTAEWDNTNTAGSVEYYELRWRNPTDWVEVTLQNKFRNGVEFQSSRVFVMKDVAPGTVEVNVRACSDSDDYRTGESCNTGMTEGSNGGCCSDWATASVTVTSQPTKPVITP
jgi:hypothetical protein